jgi:hypothetical protein
LTSVFRKQDSVSNSNAQGDELAILAILSRADFNDYSMGSGLRLADDDSRGCFGLLFSFADDDSVEEGEESLEG